MTNRNETVLKLLKKIPEKYTIGKSLRDEINSTRPTSN